MNFISAEISVAAIIPALILAAYVFMRDRVEKEPVGLLAVLFAAGGIMYLPVHYAEKAVTGLIDSWFSDYAVYTLDGFPEFSSDLAKYSHGLLVVFLGVAVIEEIVKWLVMFFCTRKNRNFNCLFDAIVYGSFVSLGFGMVENIHYAWQGGWDVLLLRTLVSLPGHMCFGIVMGYCYTMWSVYKSAAIAEKEYEKQGLIKVEKPFRTGIWFALMIILPILVHSIYGFAGFFHSLPFEITFYVFNAVLFVLCIIGIRKISKDDTYRGRFADALLDKKYPETKNICDDVEEDLEVFAEEEEDDNEQI